MTRFNKLSVSESVVFYAHGIKRLNQLKEIGIKMRIEITYIIHNCFTLNFDQECFLFDFPSGMPPRIRSIAEKQINGKKCTVFVSHAHQDHFTKKIFDFPKSADSIRYFISSDVLDKAPQIENRDKVRIVEPGRTYEIDGLEIETLLSNDAGVAFIIRYKGALIYFGGDLADWTRDHMDEATNREVKRIFQAGLEKIRDLGIDIAFSNADKRTREWSGAWDFIRQTDSSFFVPMHTFNNTGWVKEFFDEIQGDPGVSHTEVFVYKSPGDKMVIDI